MKVLIVCEDPTHDRYVVEPVVARLLTDLGAKARTEVLADPHLRGVDDLLAQLPSIVADNPMIDLFVVVIDRDGNRRNNVERLDNAVLQLNKNASPGKLVGCCAIEEVEAWLLALHRDALPNPWPVVRQDCDVKERHALPFLRQRGNGGPGQGRKEAMRELGRGWRGLQQLCDEIAVLRGQIEMSLQGLR